MGRYGGRAGGVRLTGDEKLMLEVFCGVAGGSDGRSLWHQGRGAFERLQRPCYTFYPGFTARLPGLVCICGRGCEAGRVGIGGVVMSFGSNGGGGGGAVIGARVFVVVVAAAAVVVVAVVVCFCGVMKAIVTSVVFTRFVNHRHVI